MKICKFHPDGSLALCWQGTLHWQNAHTLCVVARFQLRERLELGYTVFEKNDLFIEWFFTDRYYSIYEIWNREQTALKGWYCNIVRPARQVGDEIHSVDLALDLWVFADGRRLTLDAEEFAALEISAPERALAWQAFDALEGLASAGALPQTRLAHLPELAS